MADNYGPPPVQGPEHERLGAFIGTWHAQGQSYGQNQDRKNPRAAVLVGHSMGVSVVHQFFRLFPKKTRALVAADGSLSSTESDAAETKKCADSLAGPAFTQLQAKLVDSFFTDKTPTDLRQAAKTTMARTPQHVAASAMKGLANQTIWKTPIEVPVQAIIEERAVLVGGLREAEAPARSPDALPRDGGGRSFPHAGKPEGIQPGPRRFLRTEGLLRP